MAQVQFQPNVLSSPELEFTRDFPSRLAEQAISPKFNYVMEPDLFCCDRQDIHFCTEKRPRPKMDRLVMFAASALVGAAYPPLGLLIGFLDAIDE